MRQPGIADSGYVESVNNAATGSTILLWHGISPLQQTIIDYGAKIGVAVTIQPRDYDRATLEAAAKDALTKPDQISGFKITAAVAVSAEYDGVIIEGTATQQSVTATRLSARKLMLPVPATNGAPAVNVRAKLVAGEAPKPLTATRENDSAPFNAGGFMLDPTMPGHRAQTCSTGFAIKQNGITFTTTARHCHLHHYRAYDGTASYGDGVVNSGDGAGRQLNARGSKLMFDGAYNNAAGYTKTVIGYGAVSIGDDVCTSGGNSGVHCGTKIDAAGVMANDGFSTVSTIRATASGTASAATFGDSGGPVFITAGTGQVRAVGMIQWGALEPDSPYRRACDARTQLICSARVGFTLMSVIVNTIPGASLVTS